jgi:hypothetical protein
VARAVSVTEALTDDDMDGVGVAKTEGDALGVANTDCVTLGVGIEDWVALGVGIVEALAEGDSDAWRCRGMSSLTLSEGRGLSCSTKVEKKATSSSATIALVAETVKEDECAADWRWGGLDGSGGRARLKDGTDSTLKRRLGIDDGV